MAGTSLFSAGLDRWWRDFSGALFLCLCATLWSSAAAAQDYELDQQVQLRFGAVFKKKLNKHWSVNVSPELRTKEVIDPDRYLLEAQVTYEPIKYVDIKAMLRGDLNETNDGLGYGARPGLSVTGGVPLGDFKPELRLLYTFDFGHLRESEHRLRYRGSLEYNVPKIRLEARLSAEAFQRLSSGVIFKMRYGLDLDYKFYNTKKLDQFIYLGYALDYFLIERLNVHIISSGYKLHF